MSDSRDTITEQAKNLLELEEGWDTYGGLKPDPEAVAKAAELAFALQSHFSYPPNLVPLSDGNIQVEWHCDGWDIEMVVEKFR